MSDYEAQRKALIARNRARLVELGLLAAVDDAKTAIAAAKPKKPTKARKEKKPKQPVQPTRHSARSAGHAPAPLSAEEAALAQLLVDQVCPKCSKVVTVGQQKHLANCRGTGAPHRQHRRRGADGFAERELMPDHDEYEDDEYEDGDAPEVTELPEVQRKKQEAKLSALELSGLIEMTDQEARFLVVGSTGSRYTVALGGAKRSCGCMDHRLRRHDCKHIRLVLQQLALDGSSAQGGWRQAVEKQVAAAAAGTDSGAGDGEAGTGLPSVSPAEDSTVDPAASPKQGVSRASASRASGSKAKQSDATTGGGGGGGSKGDRQRVTKGNNDPGKGAPAAKKQKQTPNQKQSPEKAHEQHGHGPSAAAQPGGAYTNSGGNMVGGRRRLPASFQK